MGKATSDRAPGRAFEVERYPGNSELCDIIINTYDGSQDYVDNDGKTVFVYNIYRLTNWRWRETLEADIESHYEDWKEAAYRVEYTALADSARAERDKLLAASDYALMPDYHIDAENKASWEMYRQALRDVPEQANFPFSVMWPYRP